MAPIAHIDISKVEHHQLLERGCIAYFTIREAGSNLLMSHVIVGEMIEECYLAVLTAKAQLETLQKANMNAQHERASTFLLTNVESIVGSFYLCDKAGQGCLCQLFVKKNDKYVETYHIVSNSYGMVSILGTTFLFESVESLLAYQMVQPRGISVRLQAEGSFIVALPSPTSPHRRQFNTLAGMKLEDQVWFHFDLPRAEAEARLAGGQLGFFLIREAHSSQTASFAISVNTSEGVHHVLIDGTALTGFNVNGENCGYTLSDVLSVCEQPDQWWLPTCLVSPCPSPNVDAHEPGGLLVQQSRNLLRSMVDGKRPLLASPRGSLPARFDAWDQPTCITPTAPAAAGANQLLNNVGSEWSNMPSSSERTLSGSSARSASHTAMVGTAVRPVASQPSARGPGTDSVSMGLSSVASIPKQAPVTFVGSNLIDFEV